MMAVNSAPSMTTSRSRFGGFSGFAAATATLIALFAFALTFVFRGEGDSKAIWISAAVAFLSQVAAFPAVKRMIAKNLMAGWAIGSLVRFGTLGAYALLAAMVLDLQMTPALISLALFYFLSMVIEPLFLRT